MDGGIDTNEGASGLFGGDEEDPLDEDATDGELAPIGANGCRPERGRSRGG